MQLKPQDLLVAFKLAAWGRQRWTYARLAQELGISTSEAHACVKRGLAAGLLQRQDDAQVAPRRGSKPSVPVGKAHVIERKVGRAKAARSGQDVPTAVQASPVLDNPAEVSGRALAEFVVHGAKYAFVAELTPVCGGVPTGMADPVFAGADPGEEVEAFVWPHAQGKHRGTGVKPLHGNVPFAAMQDARLYELLANFDLLRIGRPKDRVAAAKRLQGWLSGGESATATPSATAAPSPLAATTPLAPEPVAVPAAAHTDTPTAREKPRRGTRQNDKPDDQFAFVFEN